MAAKRLEQRCGLKFLHAEKMSPIDIQQHLLNIYGHQTVDSGTVRPWWCVSAVVTRTVTGADRYECGMQARVHHW